MFGLCRSDIDSIQIQYEMIVSNSQDYLGVATGRRDGLIVIKCDTYGMQT